MSKDQLRIDLNAGYNQDEVKGNSFTFGKKEGKTKVQNEDLEENVLGDALSYIDGLTIKINTTPIAVQTKIVS